MNLKSRRGLKKIASVLLGFAQAHKLERTYETTLRELSGALLEQPKFVEFLDAPVFALKERLGILRPVLKGFQLDDPLLKTLELLVEQSMVHALGEFVDLYSELLKERLNFLEARVVSSVPLETKDQERILKALQDIYPGYRISLKEEVDPGLLGGFVLYVADWEYDLSILGELDQLLSWMTA